MRARGPFSANVASRSWSDWVCFLRLRLAVIWTFTADSGLKKAGSRREVGHRGPSRFQSGPLVACHSSRCLTRDGPAGSVCRFGRNLRFHHFNKLTPRDFASAQSPHYAVANCAGTEMLIRMFKNDLRARLEGGSSWRKQHGSGRAHPSAARDHARPIPRISAARGSPGPLRMSSKLKQLAKGNTPTGVMSIKLQRPVAAIRQQGATRGYFAAAGQPLALQSANQDGEAALTFAPPGDNRTQRGRWTWRSFFRFLPTTSAHRYAPTSNPFPARAA